MNRPSLIPGTKNTAVRIGLAALFTVLLCCGAHAMMTPAEEARMGQKVLDEIRKQLTLIEDPQIVGYVDRVGRGILEHVGYKDYPYQFYVVDNATMNAFAIPGGHIFVYRGLLDIMDRESELAAVLAHEIGHVQARHIARRLEQSTPLNIATIAGALLAVLAGGGKAAGAVLMGTSAAALTYELKFSRQNEEEADRLAVKYLTNAGYNVESMVRVFKNMAYGQFLGPDQTATYLSTHPGLNDRIVYLENMIHAHEFQSDSERDAVPKNAFLKAKIRLIALYDNPNTAANKLSALAEREEGPLPHYGMGLLLERVRRVHAAMEAYRNAVRLDPGNAEFLTQLGVACYITGNCNEAAGYLDRALEVDPAKAEALLYMGRIHLDEGRYRQAQQFLEKLKSVNPDSTEVYQYLGLAYGRNQELVAAHEYYGVFFERSGNRRNALYHYEQALEYARNSQPGRAGELEKRIERLKSRQDTSPRPPEKKVGSMERYR